MPDNLSPDFTSKANRAWKILLIFYGAQLLLTIAATTVLAPTHKQPNIFIGILECVPLLLLLPWLLRRSIRAAVWLCFMQLGYFLPSAQHMFMIEQYGWVPFAEAALIIALFIAAMLFARWEQKRLGISVTR